MCTDFGWHPNKRDENETNECNAASEKRYETHVFITNVECYDVLLWSDTVIFGRKMSLLNNIVCVCVSFSSSFSCTDSLACLCIVSPSIFYFVTTHTHIHKPRGVEKESSKGKKKNSRLTKFTSFSLVFHPFFHTCPMLCQAERYLLYWSIQTSFFVVVIVFFFAFSYTVG